MEEAIAILKKVVANTHVGTCMSKPKFQNQNHLEVLEVPRNYRISYGIWNTILVLLGLFGLSSEHHNDLSHKRCKIIMADKV